MKKTIIVMLMILTIFVAGCVQTPPEINPLETKCVETGGTVVTSLCCKSSGDFPRMDLIGACGCSPDNSHEVKICDCGENIWNGESCIESTPNCLPVESECTNDDQCCSGFCMMPTCGPDIVECGPGFCHEETTT